jgi:predicted DNA-binding transcriptional regulator AlpA
MRKVERAPRIGDSYPPRAMRAEQAASYLSMSRASFLRLVEQGVMPTAIKVRGMALWDRLDLDNAWEELKEKPDSKPRNTINAILGITDETDEN